MLLVATSLWVLTNTCQCTSVFHVLSSKITVEPHNQTGPVVLGLQLVRALSSPYADYAAIIENGQSVHRLIPDNYDVPFSLSLAQRTATTFGVRDPTDEPDLGGSASADPTSPLQFVVFVQDPNSSSSVSVQFVVTIEYDVLFVQPAALAQS